MGARIVFMGSPEFALPTLQRLLDSEREVVAVYAQPDRPAGRGRGLRPPPTKELALSRGVPVLQPPRVSTPESVAEMASLRPDLIVIAAFGQILRQPVLDVPRRGALNVHASLLPRHRGASPVAAAILAGDEETGVSIMQVELALDAGPVLAARRLSIDPWDTTGSLTSRLAEEGADLLLEVLPGWLEGTLAAVPQDETQATYAPIVRKEDGRIDWSLPADELWRRVRAYNPWPGAFTLLDGQPFRILAAWPVPVEAGVPPGTVVAAPPEAALPHRPDQTGGRTAAFAVQTGRALLGVVEVQKAGRRALPAEEFLRGERGLLGKRLG